MRYYISGPVTGTEDYMERFRAAEEHLKSLGYSVINPVSVNSMMPEDTTWEEYMALSMKMLEMCDGIVLLNGWRRSMGANREYGYALGADMKIVFPYDITDMKECDERRAVAACVHLEPVDVWSEDEAPEQAAPEEEKDVSVETEEKAENVHETEENSEAQDTNGTKKRKILDRGKIMALYKAGWAVKKIAEELGVSPGVISTTLWKMRKAGEIQ